MSIFGGPSCRKLWELIGIVAPRADDGIEMAVRKDVHAVLYLLVAKCHDLETEVGDLRRRIEKEEAQ